MPVYTFSVQEDSHLPHHLDLELHDMEAAKREALRAAGGFLSESGPSVWLGDDWNVRVSENGSEVLNIRCSAKMTDSER